MMIGDETFDFRKKLNHYEKKIPLKISEFLEFLYFKSLNFEKDVKRKIDIMHEYIDDKPKILDGKYPSSISIKVTKEKFNNLINKFPFLYIRTINQSFNFTRC